MATVKLSKGSRVELEKGVSKVRFDLSWTPSDSAQDYDLDIIAVELNSDQTLFEDDPRYLIFYNNLQDPNGGVKHMGDDRTGENGERIEANLDNIPKGVKEVLFILNIFKSGQRHQNFGEIHNIKLRAYTDENTDIPALMYDLENETSHKTATVLKVFSVYRSEGGGLWKVRAINEGVTSTLAGVLRSFGIDVDDNSI